MTEPWDTTMTAFALTRRGPSWLMVRHERLGVTMWELPGGHVEPGEALEQAAIRETLEETGVVVDVGRMLALCVHEWHERRQRKVICFFEATASGDDAPSLSAGEQHIVEAAWVDPLRLDETSPFLGPLVEQERLGWPTIPTFFTMTHHRNADGLWQPVAQHPPPRLQPHLNSDGGPGTIAP